MIHYHIFLEKAKKMQFKKYIPHIQSKNRAGRITDSSEESWVYQLLPKGIWPYAQLARWDRPVGWQLLLWPCWWSTALAAHTENNKSFLWQLILFLIGAIAMRGAGCTYNDLIDQKIDGEVERTRSRPLPSEQISRKQAICFMFLQSLIGFVVLIQFNFLTIILGLISLILVAIYPFMKRITDWPQLFLGIVFNWGALLGWTATSDRLTLPPVFLYLGAVLWTMGYDTIYAYQDKEDDVLIGIGSTAQLFKKRTKFSLFCMYGMMAILISFAFILAHMPLITLSGLVLAALHMLYQIKELKVNSPHICLKLFKANTIVGFFIFLGILSGSLFP
ncbi:MAG: 4-hydroxybenzoate polyprenyltransferase [Candidatus Tokpelaia sp. JSC161]|jgi:4-hydroxybenzoate polyprenyltransferase|nr:MAG: 4-hydroxybenzoate polyprenyltransferase [Candidatus Tokpelaia sp. JSC161]